MADPRKCAQGSCQKVFREAAVTSPFQNHSPNSFEGGWPKSCESWRCLGTPSTPMDSVLVSSRSFGKHVLQRLRFDHFLEKPKGITTDEEMPWTVALPRLRSPFSIASAICTPWWFSTIFGAWFCACFVDEMLVDKEKRCWVPAAPHLYAQASCCQRDLGKDHGVPLLVLHSSVQWQNTKERLWGAGCRWPQRQANEEMCPLGHYWAITGGLEFFASEFNWPYRNANEICPYCCADQKQESERPFTDMRPTAAWRSTILSPADLAKKFKHPLFKVPGVSVLTLKLDILHLLDFVIYI